MKLTPWYLAALAPIAVVGCSGELLGHVAVLAVTFGIFFGTLSLGRVSATGVGTGGAPSVDAQTPAAVVVPPAQIVAERA